MPLKVFFLERRMGFVLFVCEEMASGLAPPRFPHPAPPDSQKFSTKFPKAKLSQAKVNPS